METIPRHIKAPDNIELKGSQVDASRIGAFSLERIPKDAEFGPYSGKIVYNKNDDAVDPKYSWEVFDLETFKFLHIVDATDPADGNWMRYVCCARFFEEQNIVSTQNGQEVYYKALKEIEPGEELLTWFQPKKKRRKRSSILLSTELPVQEPETPNDGEDRSGTSSPTGVEKGKRKRKPKIIPDSYHGPLDVYNKKSKQAYDDMFEPLQPGQKRRRRKKISTDSRSSSSSTLDMATTDNALFVEIIKSDNGAAAVDNDTADSVIGLATSLNSSKDIKKENGQSSGLSISEINNSVDWVFPTRGQEYLFELRDHHVTVRNGKKVYQCDICLGLYKHMFSLKRHYLRNHVNYKYLSKADMTNCLINLAQVKQNMKERGIEVCESKVELSNESNDPDEIKKENADTVDMIGNTADANGVEEIRDCKADPSNETCEKEDDKITDMEIDEVKSEETAKRNEEQINGETTPENLNGCHELKEKDDQKSESLSENSEEASHSSDSSEVMKAAGHSVQDLDNSTLSDTELKPMPGLFRCYTCYEVFDSVEQVREHVQNHPKQEEGSCFPCDECNMRFNYKQNLVRHKKVHEAEGNHDSPHNMLPDCGDDDASLSRTGSKDSPAKTTPSLLPAGAAYPNQSEMYQVFKCSKCKTNFESLLAMRSHVQAEHLSGNKYQCQYCGKDFPSMPNMKKHVRFHLGYRVSCRFCPEYFPNVGALRKHTRLAHLEIYRAKQLEKLDNQAAQNKKSNSEKEINKKCDQNLADKEETVKNTVDSSKKEESEHFSYDHEISFAADEIDDGGSRFKFSCTVCKKRFSNYINMCRHRRKSHSNDSKPRHEELSLSFCQKARKSAASPVQEDPVEVAQFYANISHNIATNLNCYIDGHQQSLEKFVDHIKIEDYSGELGYNPEKTGQIDFTWEQYNFPPNYKPGKTISYEEISKGIRSSLDLLSEVHAKTVLEVNNSETVSNTIEGGQSPSIKEHSEEMGKHSVGFQPLDAVANIQKQHTGATMEDNKYTTLKIAGGVIEHPSTESKNFSQVMKGEYASFDDDLLPSDVSSLEEPRLNSRSIKEARIGQRSRTSSDVSKNKNNKDTASAAHLKLMEAAQAELEELYDSIENHDYDKVTRKEPTETHTPASLSAMCEKILGIKKITKRMSEVSEADNTEEINSETMLLNELNLASQRAASVKLTNGVKSVVPDYSDVPDGSPFYNYESIAFGKSGEVVSVCAVCKRQFKDIEGVLRHHWKKHPGSVFQILEVEQGNDIDKLHFTEPSYVGALAVTDPGLESVNEMETFTCTKCGGLFRTLSKLHVHIVNCSPIDPVYGSTKLEKSPSKMSFTKKLQRKFHSLLGKDQVSKAMEKKNGATLGEVKSQKRVFMGCRKRKSVILPDSPMKATMHLTDLRTGYNPHRHIRRRELTELIDTLTCEACGLKFKTIILLERHVKNCTKKEKFKNVHPLACPIMDESLARIKNICFYCEKNFTYAKSLINHFQDFCPVKKARSDRGGLTENDKIKEEEVIERMKRMEDEKLIRDPDHVKKKITWQVGRKPKRKGHAWTYIKKRKQLLTEGIDNGVDEDTNDKVSDSNEDSVEKPTSESQDHEENGDKAIAREQIGSGFDEVDSASHTSMCNMEKDIPDTVENTMVDTVDIKEENSSQSIDTVDNKDIETKQTEVMKQEEFKETHLNDMSLDCTSRYQVNKITVPKMKKTSDSVSKPSVIFQCISSTEENKNMQVKVEPNAAMSQKKADDTSSLIIRSKRKRERVSKVEEFLRNAFRRKRGSKSAKAEDKDNSLNHEKHDSMEENRIKETVSKDDAAEQMKSELLELTENDSRNKEDSHENNHQVLDIDEKTSNQCEVNRENISTRYLETLAQPMLEQTRKRGRPRKFPLPADYIKSPAQELKYVRGGRGRPPYASKFYSGKRGRPPKFRSISSVDNFTGQHDALFPGNEIPVNINHETNKSLDSGNPPSEKCEEIENQLVHISQNKTENETFSNQSVHVSQNKTENETFSNQLVHVSQNKIENETFSNENKSDQHSSITQEVSALHSMPVAEEIMTETTDESDCACQCFDESSNESSEDCEVQSIVQPQILTLKENKNENGTEENAGVLEIYDDSVMTKPADNKQTFDEELEKEKSDIYDKIDPENTDRLEVPENADRFIPSEIAIVEDLHENSKEQVETDNLSFEKLASAIDSLENVTDKELKIEEKPPDCKDINEMKRETCTVDEQKAEVKTSVENEKDSSVTEIVKMKAADEKYESEEHDTDNTNNDSDDEEVSKQSIKSHEEGAKTDDSECDVVDIGLCSSDRSAMSHDSFVDNENNNRNISSESSAEIKADENHETSLPKSPEPVKEEKYEMVLSPSERVKMNKRSCMKDRNPFTPVWVRKPSKPKSKAAEPEKAKAYIKEDAMQNQLVVPSVNSSNQNNLSVVLSSKKPLFKKRQEAVNERLKLLDKKVNSGHSDNLTSKTVKTKPIEWNATTLLNQDLAGKVNYVRGVKRKQSDLNSTDSIDNIPVKRKSESSKVGKNLISEKTNSNNSKVETKAKDLVSDKKAQKVK